MSDERARFAQIVPKRRRLLGLTLDELQAAGGPSDVTTGKIEKGAIASPSARTFGGRLRSRASLGRGSGGQGVRRRRPHTHRGPTFRASAGGPSAVAADTDSWTLSLNVVNDLSDIAKRYEQLASVIGDPKIAAELAEVNTISTWLLTESCAPGSSLS
ncbi:hypothetical protein GS582_35870 [Rhodococcus hoagii]|nr:hypothetical protein [Prescottella equi]